MVLCTKMSIILPLKEDLNKINDIINTYEYDKYIKLPFYNTKQAKKYLFDKIKDFYLKNPDTTILIESNGEIVGLICYEKSVWDTNHFGFNVASIKYLLTKPMSYMEECNIKSDLLNNFEEWCKKEKIRFINTKIDSGDYSTIHVLEKFGFNYMSTVITTLLDCRDIKDFKFGLILRNLKDNEIDVIARMAENIFKENRFYLDKRFDKKKASEIHGEWIRNRYRQNPYSVYVLEDKGDIIGFCNILIEDLSDYFGLKIAYLDLDGISQKYIGKSYDFSLYAGMINLLKKKVDIIDTDFITRNIPVFNIYTKFGFRFAYSKIALHKWRSIS